MKSISDSRRLRIYQLGVVDGELVRSSAADAWQDDDGMVQVTGLWDGVVPVSPEEMKIRAGRAGVSTLEWFRQRLLSSVVVTVEVVS